MLFVLCTSLHLIHQPTAALNNIQFVTDINFLHVLGQGYHPQGVILDSLCLLSI